MSAGDSRKLPPELHVAQQSRRDKLRIHPAPNSLGHIADLLRVRDVVRVSAAKMMNFSDSGRVQFVPPPSAAPRSGEHRQPLLVGDWAPAPPLLVPSNQVYYHHQPLIRPSFAGYNDGSGELHFANQSQELASVVAHEHVRSYSWSAGADVGTGGNELMFLPSCSFANGGNPRPFLPWPADYDFVAGKPEEMAVFSGALPSRAAGGLSLTLSSNPVAAAMEDRLAQGDGDGTGSGPSSPYPKFSAVTGGTSGRGVTKSMTAAVDPRRGVGIGGAGPLGPFTGYTTILKSSKFSRPAQLLLEEFCSIIRGSKVTGKQCEATGSKTFFRTSSGGGCDVVDFGKDGSARQVSSIAVSSSSLHSSTEAGGSGGSTESYKVHKPEFQQKKATLLNLQEEVCRKYKQYHQQMQMVVSSFDSVSGLSSAAPYTSSALKSVSKHFRSLKNTISNQLQLVSKVLGEEHISSPISSRGENMTNSQMKYLDQSLQKQKGSSESSLGYMGHPQPVWRPQRGLPEQAVSVLRTWLFEHFLHPYPTDMDKHMLASQTGLSRNQVSNWFINARVRLWKPMVEEIHMLETKGMSRMDLNTASEERNTDAAKDDGLRQRKLSVDQTAHVHCSEPLDCGSLDPGFNDENLEPLHCDKRLRTTEDCSGGISPTAMDGDLVSFSAYHHHHAMDIAGIDAVSLSLGLRHEGGRQDSQQMGHFGTTMLHDFVS